MIILTNTRKKVQVAIKKLLDLISKTNIAEDFDNEDGDEKLNKIGREAQEGFNADWDSMSDWRDGVMPLKKVWSSSNPPPNQEAHLGKVLRIIKHRLLWKPG
jgi:hypothetical protein